MSKRFKHELKPQLRDPKVAHEQMRKQFDNYASSKRNIAGAMLSVAAVVALSNYNQALPMIEWTGVGLSAIVIGRRVNALKTKNDFLAAFNGIGRQFIIASEAFTPGLLPAAAPLGADYGIRLIEHQTAPNIAVTSLSAVVATASWLIDSRRKKNLPYQSVPTKPSIPEINQEYLDAMKADKGLVVDEVSIPLEAPGGLEDLPEIHPNLTTLNDMLSGPTVVIPPVQPATPLQAPSYDISTLYPEQPVNE